MKQMFIGPSGKIPQVGGSRVYTVPTTVEVSGTSYEISTQVQGEFVTHSLDGRLWVILNEGSYGILALKFNRETEKLEFATSRTITLTNERILARGLDWILTSKNIFMASDKSPYILSASLYDDNIPEKYLYSILRTSVNSEKPSGFSVNVGSGVDPFTHEAWGKSELNGNSDGSGYFSRDTELLKPAGSFVLDKSYSVLPSVGDWQILPNYLLRRPDAALSESYNGQLNLRPLIPLEFNLYSNGSAYPTYGCGYEHDISLAIIDGELWARGFSHIGKVKILPAVFNEDGEVEEYYLYISPEYPCSPFDEKESSSLDANSDWLKLKIAQFGGYLSEPSDSLSDGLVETVDDTRIFSLQTKEYTDGSTGKFYVDMLNSSGLILNDNGANFLNGANYECRGLSQWLAPGGKIESITSGSVVSSIDGGLLNTSIQTGFNRQLLRVSNPELTAKSYAGSRLILNEYEASERKSFHVNKYATPSEGILSWENIYKTPLDVKNIKVFKGPNHNYYEDCIMNYDDWYGYPIFVEAKYYNEDPAITDVGPDGLDSDGNYVSGFYDTHSFTARMFYINPETGKLEGFVITTGLPHSTNASWIYTEGDKILIEFAPYNDYRFCYDDFYSGVVSPIPEAFANWLPGYTDYRWYRINPAENNESVLLKTTSTGILIQETSTKTTFFIESQLLKDNSYDDIFLLSIPSKTPYVTDYRGQKKYLKMFHVFKGVRDLETGEVDYITFQTICDPEQLDFDAELVRSEKK